MRRVTWRDDVVDHVRTSSPSACISIGTVLIFIAERGVSEENCILALQSFTTPGNIFKAAATIAPYCIHPSISAAKNIFYALSFPFDHIDARKYIAQCTSIQSLDDYIDTHAIIQNKALVYKWVLAYTSIPIPLARDIIIKTRRK